MKMPFPREGAWSSEGWRLTGRILATEAQARVPPELHHVPGDVSSYVKKQTPDFLSMQQFYKWILHDCFS